MMINEPKVGGKNKSSIIYEILMKSVGQMLYLYTERDDIKVYCH